MDRKALLQILNKQKKSELTELLIECSDLLSPAKRQKVFGSLYASATVPVYSVRKTHNMVNRFYNDSLSKEYYAPFDMNSRNYSEIPDETEMWCETMAELLRNSMALTSHGDHAVAVECFSKLFSLLEEMEEIVFAHELGPWMVPIQLSKVIPRFIESMAAACEPGDFKRCVQLLIKLDEYDYRAPKVLNAANKRATTEQRAAIADLKPKQGRRN